MSNFIKVFGTGLMICAFSLPATAGEKVLKGKDIRGLFPGTYMAEVSGYNVVIKAHGNGTLRGSAFNKSDKGRWWIKGDRLCVSWSNWTSGEASCGHIRQSGKWYKTHSAKGPMKFRRI